tara:strand:- start:922 stop:1611 length:690 start_codon:yes stop_codon:yes gene_type:complete
MEKSMSEAEQHSHTITIEVPASAKYSNGRRSPLAKPGWQYVEEAELADFSAEEWTFLNAQSAEYSTEERANAALRMLGTLKDDPSFGYQVNTYTHCLQSATMVMRAGWDEEDIVTALFHDMGLIVCPEAHGPFSAALMGPLVSEKNYWMLRHHQIFMNSHSDNDPSFTGDKDAREVYRGHPHFEYTATFVDKFDQNALQADYDTASIEVFLPMVYRVFARKPHAVPVID